MTVREVLRLLQDDGWYLARTKGSHRQFKHPSRPGLVTVAGKPSDDLAPGTLNSNSQASRAETMKLLVVVEQSQTGFSAYVPDLPGCVATGATRPEVEQLIREAIEFHLEGLRADGHLPPTPQCYATVVEVAA